MLKQKGGKIVIHLPLIELKYGHMVKSASNHNAPDVEDRCQYKGIYKSFQTESIMK
jgi:hypothetical protein